MKTISAPTAFEALAVLADAPRMWPAPPGATYAALALSLAWLALSRWLIRFL